jgi:hypothetical protein
VCVRVCTCVRERERESVCVRVCVCVFVREREREGEKVSALLPPMLREGSRAYHWLRPRRRPSLREHSLASAARVIHHADRVSLNKHPNTYVYMYVCM